MDWYYVRRRKMKIIAFDLEEYMLQCEIKYNFLSVKSNWWITFLFWVLFAEKWGLRCIREAPLYLPARFCVDSWLAGLPNSRKNHSQSALYWLFPKPIPPSPSHSTASIIMVHWLLPSQGFVVFCLFSPPDKLPPHLILGDFPWVRFEVLCGFVKTSDGRQHFNFIPFPHTTTKILCCRPQFYDIS